MELPDIVLTIWPELTLIAVGCLLFLVGISNKPSFRRSAAWIALLTLAAVFAFQLSGMEWPTEDSFGTFKVGAMAKFIKVVGSGVAMIFTLMAWPTNKNANGSASIDYASETAEFFGLLLLSVAGLFLVAGANDIVVLFLGMVLASTPTYIMISVARPLPMAQEAGVKYFFLGALANAVALLGFSYLYGTTGTLYLTKPEYMITPNIADVMAANGHVFSTWQLMALVLLVLAFSFKMAAVPLHFYVADVYQGAATPITAFLSWIPKTTGLIAIIKILSVMGGEQFVLPTSMLQMMWGIAAVTMTVGNVLATVQPHSVKRVLAYSSVAHSGYLLAGLTAALYAGAHVDSRIDALTGVMFYLVAYGVMNAGAFAVLQLLPARGGDFQTASDGTLPPSAQAAESFDDIAGAAKRHPVLGLAMAICCFSLIGLPLTVGFFGKLLLIKPALDVKLYGLAILIMINAAISAAYYLRIVVVLYLRPEPEIAPGSPTPVVIGRPFPIMLALAISAVGSIALGTIMPFTGMVTTKARDAAQQEFPMVMPMKTVSVDR